MNFALEVKIWGYETEPFIFNLVIPAIISIAGKDGLVYAMDRESEILSITFGPRIGDLVMREVDPLLSQLKLLHNQQQIRLHKINFIPIKEREQNAQT